MRPAQTISSLPEILSFAPMPSLPVSRNDEKKFCTFPSAAGVGRMLGKGLCAIAVSIPPGFIAMGSKRWPPIVALVCSLSMNIPLNYYYSLIEIPSRMKKAKDRLDKMGLPSKTILFFFSLQDLLAGASLGDIAFNAYGAYCEKEKKTDGFCSPSAKGGALIAGSLGTAALRLNTLLLLISIIPAESPSVLLRKFKNALQASKVNQFDSSGFLLTLWIGFELWWYMYGPRTLQGNSGILDLMGVTPLCEDTKNCQVNPGIYSTFMGIGILHYLFFLYATRRPLHRSLQYIKAFANYISKKSLAIKILGVPLFTVFSLGVPVVAYISVDGIVSAFKDSREREDSIFLYDLPPVVVLGMGDCIFTLLNMLGVYGVGTEIFEEKQPSGSESFDIEEEVQYTRLPPEVEDSKQAEQGNHSNCLSAALHRLWHRWSRPAPAPASLEPLSLNGGPHLSHS